MTLVKRSVAGIAAAIAAAAFLGCFTTVGAGERGVVLTWGAFNGRVLDPGLHFLVPFAQSAVKMDVRTAKLEIPQSESYTSDLQNVGIHSVVNYNPDPAQVGVIYQRYGLGYEGKILHPNLEAAVKQTVARYSAEQVLSKRGQVQEEIESAFRSSIPAEFSVTGYALVNETFSETYEKAIEAKQVAQQNAEKAVNELRQAQVDADARVAKARGEAEAIKISAEAINSQGGADYVQLQAIARWNGVLPAQFVPGQSLPFINVGR